MSTDQPDRTRRSLGGYIEAMVAALADGDGLAAARLQRVASGRGARVVLDDDAVDVRFRGGRLSVQPADPARHVDGTGRTDRATVLDLLAGHLEASAAILDGRIAIEGSPDAVAAMMLIIEIMLDAAPRNPVLQQLADEFVSDSAAQAQLISWYPAARSRSEDDLLARLGLLPDQG
jgi:hypothetical protein